MMNIKVIYFTCFLLLSGLLGFGQADSSTYFRVEKAIQDARMAFGPDKRTRIIELREADLQNNRFTIQTTEKSALPFLKEQLATANITLDLILYPHPSIANTPFGVVNLSVANLRTRPSHAAELATQLLMGTAVDILEHKSGNFRVRTPEGYIAWVPEYSITAMDSTTFTRWKEDPKIIYTNEFGKSYSSKDLSSLRVSDLVYGNLVVLEEKEDAFYRVRYPDNRVAYVSITEAELFDTWENTRKLTRDNIIRSAKTMLGLPYLWGGTSVKGVDCSGFTKTVFYMNGHIIPRDASQQVLAGDAVDIMDDKGNFDAQMALKELAAGDLLFFSSSKGQRDNPRVTHVAIYLGNGEFIHAAGAVRINSFLPHRSNYDDFQTRTVVGAKRYIGSNDSQIQPIAMSKYY